MKKNIVFFCLILCVVLLAACGSGRLVEKAETNIAEERTELLTGNNGDVSASLMFGCREKDYVVNGFATELTEFGVITFKLNSGVELPIDEVRFVLTIGTGRFDGELEKNPFDGSYMADIKKIVTTAGKIIKAKLVCGTFSSEVELNNLTANWKLNSRQALRRATEELKEELNELIEGGELKAECYIKMINDELGDKNKYYWYVSFVSRSGKQFAAIVEPDTGDILAKKNI